MPSKTKKYKPDDIGKVSQAEAIANSSSDSTEREAVLLQRIDALEGELEAEKAKYSVSKERAKLMVPYANKVFLYLVFYTIGVLILLLLSGDKTGSSASFVLSDTVLAVIAGSTAASAIGLVGFVVNGVFKPQGK